MSLGGPRVEKKRLTLEHMLVLNAAVCGLEFCACAGFTYVPPLLLKAGFNEKNMTMIMSIGPVLGFLIVPVLGTASDNCVSRYGRRRPFMLALALIQALSLVMIAFADDICGVTGSPGGASACGVAALTVGIVMLDFSGQACFSPYEALLADMSAGSNQQERMFTIYSLMLGFGGCFGYLLTAIDWTSSSVGPSSQEKSVFTILLVLFLFTLALTFAASRDPPYVPPKPSLSNSPSSDNLRSVVTYADGQTDPPPPPSNGFLPPSPASKQPGSVLKQPSAYSNVVLFGKPPPELSKATNSVRHRLMVLRYAALSYLPLCFQQMFYLPAVLSKLFYAYFFGWMALLSYNLFFTEFVGEGLSHGHPEAPEGTPLRIQYDDGVRLGSFGLLLHCLTSAIFSAFLESTVRSYGSRNVYMFGVITFTMAMAVTVYVDNITIVMTMSATTGFFYATLMTIPFTLVTDYHERPEVFLFDSVGPHRGIGTDLASLNSLYFLAQSALSAVMGWLVEVTGSVWTYISCAAVFGLISIAFSRHIIFNTTDLMKMKNQKKLVVPVI